MKKSERGITLIALVITIIVLLILASVSISMIMGENGVLRKAMNASEATKESSAIEQVSLAWTACQSEYLAESTDVTRAKYFTKEKLNANLSEGEVTAVSIGVDDLGTSEVIYKKDNVYYKMQLIAGREWVIEGKPSTTVPDIRYPSASQGWIENFSKQITSANYGDYVDYPVDLGIASAGQALSDGTVPKTDWRIFYKDSANVFLIASNYLPTSKYPSGVFDNQNGKYRGWWSLSNLRTNKTITANNKFLFTKLSNVTNTNTNYQATARLLDSSKWSVFAQSEYVDNTSTSVIGSPTLEMWIESWNDKYNDTLVFSANVNGYQVGLTNSSLSNNINYSSMQTKTGINDTLYYPYVEYSECWGYWLASPSAERTSSMMRVGFGVDEENYSIDDAWYGVRPVVCLSSSVFATYDNANEYWRLAETLEELVEMKR